MTALSDLFIVCSHGRRSAHGIDDGSWCQGGRPATLEDLGGEKVWWCGFEELINERRYCGSHPTVKGNSEWGCGEYLLLPLQMVAE